MSEDLKEKLKSYRFWVSLASAVLLLVQAIGGPLGLTVDEETYMSIVNSALGVFVVLGIISHPAQNLFAKNKNTEIENETETTNADKGNETEAAKTNTKGVNTENLEGESAETDANETNSLKTESAKTLDNSSTAKAVESTKIVDNNFHENHTNTNYSEMSSLENPTYNATELANIQNLVNTQNEEDNTNLYSKNNNQNSNDGYNQNNTNLYNQNNSQNMNQNTTLTETQNSLDMNTQSSLNLENSTITTDTTNTRKSQVLAVNNVTSSEKQTNSKVKTLTNEKFLEIKNKILNQN